MDKLAKRVDQMISDSRKTMIIDGHYAPEIVPKEDITKVFVLRCHPKQLKQRMIERGFQGAKLKENLAAEVLDVCLTDAIASVGTDRVCEIDTTDKTIDAVLDEIISALEKKKHCAIGIVDWLGQLEAEQTLDQYLQEF
jgi:adenylate kinase